MPRRIKFPDKNWLKINKAFTVSNINLHHHHHHHHQQQQQQQQQQQHKICIFKLEPVFSDFFNTNCDYSKCTVLYYEHNLQSFMSSNNVEIKIYFLYKALSKNFPNITKFYYAIKKHAKDMIMKHNYNWSDRCVWSVKTAKHKTR
jgi:hypothetical protein